MKKFDRIEAVDYYIKGEYHCDKCPFCWGGEYMPGCDDYDDAGVISSEIFVILVG